MKNREKGHQTQFTFRFILKFFLASSVYTHIFALFLTSGFAGSELRAQPSPSVTLLNDFSVGISDASWAQWSSRLRSSYQTTFLSLDVKAELSVAGHYTLVDADGFQAFTTSSFRERISLKEISVQKTWPSADLKAGWVNIQWGLASEGPISQFFARGDLSEFTMTDEEDLPLGQVAMQGRFFTGPHRFELLFSPLPYPAPLPDRESRWNFITDLDQATIEWSPSQPEWSFDEVQFAFRYLYGATGNWQAEWVAGRWAGSLPTFGFELTSPVQMPFIPLSPLHEKSLDSQVTDSPSLPLLSLTLKEDFKPKWVTGLSLEFLPDSKWILRSDHLFRFNQKRIQLPFSRQMALNALTDPALAQGLIPLLIGDPDAHLDNGLMSQHQLSAERQVGEWTLNTAFQYTYYYNLNENSLRDPARSSLLFSGRSNAFRDRLFTEIITQWNFDPVDFRIHPSLTWQSQDLWSVTAGAQLFGGEAPDPLFSDLSFYTYRTSGFGYLRFTLFLF